MNARLWRDGLGDNRTTRARAAGFVCALALTSVRGAAHAQAPAVQAGPPRPAAEAKAARPGTPGAGSNSREQPLSRPALQANSGQGPLQVAEEETVPPRTSTVFYAWPILAIGGGAGLLTAASVGLASQPFTSGWSTAGFIVGVPTYGLAGPVVHWTHGHFEKGLVSFGANIALPLLGALVGRTVSCSSSPECGGNGLGRGAAIGFLLAPVLDALLLGWEEVPSELVGKGSFRLGPYVEVQGGRTPALGVTGQF